MKRKKETTIKDVPDFKDKYSWPDAWWFVNCVHI